MASFSGVGDNVTLKSKAPGDKVQVDISGTYNMVIALQKEVVPGGGAWQTIKSWSTANATVQFPYWTEDNNESLRLIVLTDTSGVATATLTDDNNDVTDRNVFLRYPGGAPAFGFDDQGIVVWDRDGIIVIQSASDNRFTIGNKNITLGTSSSSGNILQFSDISAFNTTTNINGGAVISASGRLIGPPPINVTTSTKSISAQSSDDNKWITLNRAAGVTVTLPTATGAGTAYKFMVGTAITSNAYIIQVTGNDTMTGVITAVDSDDASTRQWRAAAVAGADTITLGGAATGGQIGDRIELIDVATDLWLVKGMVTQSGGSEATPFSSAVT